MQVDTTRFGSLEVDSEAIITFTQPILGFQEFRRFVLLDGPEGSELRWLQSTESSELAFLLLDPRTVISDYQVELNRHDLAELAVNAVDELDLYTLVVVPQDRTKVRTNLKAPILISLKHRLAKQIILDNSNYPIQYYLSQRQNDDQPSQEVSHARSDSQRG